MRKIKLKTLLAGGIGYRLCILLFEGIIFSIYSGKIVIGIGASISMNIAKMIIYYYYHYLFLSLFKIGKDGR